MNDLISRQDAINSICQDWCGCNYVDCRHPFDESVDECYYCDGCTNAEALKVLPSAEPEQCEFCRNRGLEDGDTLYISADWDGGIGFDFIHDIHYCPKCGRRL